MNHIFELTDAMYWNWVLNPQNFCTCFIPLKKTGAQGIATHYTTVKAFKELGADGFEFCFV